MYELPFADEEIAELDIFHDIRYFDYKRFTQQTLMPLIATR